MQTVIVALIVAGAATFVARRVWLGVAAARAKKAAGCGPDCGCGPAPG
jgi:hypothetical protein